MTGRHLIVPDAVIGQRADAGLARMLGVSRTAAAQLLIDGAVSMDGEVLAKSALLPAGVLDVELPDRATSASSTPSPPVPVLWSDNHLMVIDKPVGMAAHPSPGWTGPTVTAALEGQGVLLPPTGVPERPGIVHRLDVGTSGLMVVALTEHAYSALKAAFKERRVDKTYHAVVQGHLDPTEGTIDAPIGRHPRSDYKFAVVADGRHAITHYTVVEMFPGASLVEIRLETGRTHQIRVHMQAMRHPLVGDTTYGADPALGRQLGLTRQWLHAVRLAFDHPVDGSRVDVSSPYPEDLDSALQHLRDHAW